jgi:predicted transcriptional regulator
VRSGRPSDATSTENIEAVEKLVMENRRTKVWEIAAETGLSRGTIFRILHEHLLLSKVSARWVS